ncbi:hypothetical protein ACH5RR_000397 [Cinchona calisaya]|uniref:BHLH domain-containing protein n=1 Tax=Cinchona calisaya TaxID=153742 RepID=A0ABD3B0R8_9GENT
MNQCVPSWDDVEGNHHPPPPPPPQHHHPPAHDRLPLRANSNSSSLAPDVPTLDYEVAELTWENGQLAMHGLGPPRLPNKYSWEDEKQPPAGGTLESVVNQATTIILPCRKSGVQSECCHEGGDELVPWFEDHHRAVTAPAATSLNLNMDAMVPCSNKTIRTDHKEPSTHVHVPGISTCVMGCSATRVGSCGGAAGCDTLLPRVNMAATQDWSSRAEQSHQSVSGSATCGRDSRQLSLDTCDREFGTPGYTDTSSGSPENTSYAKRCAKMVNDHDSRRSRSEREAQNGEDKKKGNRKSSVSTKRSRAAAIHNQSERKRRDKINQRMKTLQKMVPNSSKTDKASMLDEVINYLKQLQAQVNIMSRMNMPPMMLPLALQQQQLQMSMMANMGIGMNMAGMGMGVMDHLNSISRPNIAGIPPLLHPTAYIPTTASWEAFGDRLAAPSASAMPDPLAAFLACQSQPMTMDAYTRMAILYQQLQQPPGSAAKK